MSRRTLDDLRRAVEAGVLDAELFDRAERRERWLSLCWCGWSMVEHNIDALAGGDGAFAPIQDHWWSPSGTWSIAWLLDVIPDHPPFDHDHGVDETEFCVVCRIEAWERDEPPA